MNVTDNNLCLMKIDYRYNLQTKLATCINNVIELAVTYLLTCCCKFKPWHCFWYIKFNTQHDNLNTVILQCNKTINFLSFTVCICIHCCHFNYYSTPVVEQRIAISLSVCLHVSLCLSVCPRAYLWNRWTDLHEIFCADPLRPWLATLR